MLLVVMAEVMEVLTVLKARERSLAALVVLAFPVALVAAEAVVVLLLLECPLAQEAAQAGVVHHPIQAQF